MKENLENGILYQKTGLTKSMLAQDLMCKNIGDRILPIAEYQNLFGVSRGTIQNAFTYLKDCGAIVLEKHGHQGTFVSSIDYKILQENCIRQEVLGIMPLPYSLTYEGFATAMYEQLSGLNFNITYSRGAVGRIKLVESGTYQFAICSQFAAEESIRRGRNIDIIMNFGQGSFLSKHVLLFADSSADKIENGMKVAYDSNSLDQSYLINQMIQHKDVKLIPIRTQQTLAALKEGIIDVGVWNYDDIIENKHMGLNAVQIDDSVYNREFSTAALVVRRDDSYMTELLKKYVHVNKVKEILNEVRQGRKEPYF